MSINEPQIRCLAWCPECGEEIDFYVDNVEDDPEPDDEAYCPTCDQNWKYTEVDAMG